MLKIYVTYTLCSVVIVCYSGASLVAQLVKNLPATRETWVWCLGWEDALEKGKAPHSSILAWRIPWPVQLLFWSVAVLVGFSSSLFYPQASLVAQLVKNPPATQETPVRFQGVRKIPWRRHRLPTPVFLGFLVAQMAKNPPAMWETPVWPLSWEDPPEEGMTTHSSILAWRIPMDRGPWWATSMGSQRVGHDWVTMLDNPTLFSALFSVLCLALCPGKLTWIDCIISCLALWLPGSSDPLGVTGWGQRAGQDWCPSPCPLCTQGSGSAAFTAAPLSCLWLSLDS